MWGEFNDLSFWEAIRREPQHVPANERRAVLLMATMCDPERVAFYLQRGVFFARGNVTGRTFCLQHNRGHSIGVKELEDGRPRASWCIQPGDPSVPNTDHLLTVKNLIEGEEMLFRQIGNRSEGLLLFEDSRCDEGTMRNMFGDYYMSPHDVSFKENESELEAMRVQRLGVLAYRDEFFETAQPSQWKKTDPHWIVGGSIHIDRFPNDPLTMYERGIGAETQDYAEQNPVCYPGPRVDNQTAMSRFTRAAQLGEAAFRTILDDGYLAEDGAVGYLQGFTDGMDAMTRPARGSRLGDHLHGFQDTEGNQTFTGVTGAGTVLGYNPQSGFGQYPLSISRNVNVANQDPVGNVELCDGHAGGADFYVSDYEQMRRPVGCRSMTPQMAQLEYALKHVLMDGLEFKDQHQKFLKLADVEL